MMSYKYSRCPLLESGFSLVRFTELGARIMGPDGKCICTKDSKCPNVDKRDNFRCSISDLEKLDREAVSRRTSQYGDDY